MEAGDVCVLGNDDLPPEPEQPGDWSDPPSDRCIRADVLRFFLLGGCSDASVTEVGIRLAGAFISGELHLNDCVVPWNMRLHNCLFQNGIRANRCNALKNVRLVACQLPFLEAASLNVGYQMSCSSTEFQSTVGRALTLQGANIGQGLFLSSVKISGEANLASLTIGDQLDCSGAEFKNEGGRALNLQGATIGHDLFLRAAKIFGEADLKSLTIGGQLECSAAEFQNKHRRALNLQSADISQGFIFRGQTTVQGVIDLSAASCGDLVDDPNCWPNEAQGRKNLVLDGFTYHRIIGPTDARTRLNWLAKGDTWRGEFFPQPYKQLAKVLHDMGHEADAKTVRISLAQKLARNSRNERIWFTGTELGFLKALLPLPIIWVWHVALQFLTDFGYRPMKSFYWLVLLWGLATVPAHLAWEEGSFAPNSAVALQSESWATYGADHSYPPHPNPARDWSLTSTIGRDWESFNRSAYAADLVVPIIDLGQTDAWAPSTERGWWGWHLWWARWFFTLAGWIVTALGAAALTGIIRRE
ncbi:hypothetical protein [Phaeobacter piscinae]|uniref:hypothetical protein n=1 Tax=Phaeobacter piscinae TaxID=1580596 RepID=UPI0011AB7B90|nr:hypothetical protein [Phaeobacter piscinae]